MDISEKILLCPDKTIHKFINSGVVFNNIGDIINFVINYLDNEAQDCIIGGNPFTEGGNLLIKKHREKNREAIIRYNNHLDEIMNLDTEIKNSGYILFTDLVNSTAKINLLGDDKYYQNVLLKHNKILQRVIKNNDGRIIKNIGDAYLAVFCDPFKALKSCIEAQFEFEELNKGRDADDRILVRMALHRGEYSLKQVENNNIDVYGTSINYTARMVGYVGGGQILVSKTVVSDWNNFDMDNIKNIDLQWCENTECFRKSDIEYFTRIYQTKMDFYNKVSLNSIGFFSFKGFEKDQELFNLIFSGDLKTIKKIDDMINEWMYFSIQEDSAEVSESDILLKSIRNFIINSPKETIQSVLKEVDYKTIIAIMLSEDDRELKDKFWKNITVDMGNQINSTKGFAETEKQLLSRLREFNEIINKRNG
jgi:class 3 adenylate cyclase